MPSSSLQAMSDAIAPCRNPQKLAELIVEPPNNGRRVVCLPSARRYFRMGEREAALLESLQGDASVEALKAAQVAGFTPEQIERLIAWFTQQGLLVGSEVSGTQPLTLRARILKFVTDFFLRPGELRITLFRPDAFLDRHRNVIDALCSIPALLMYAAILASPMALASAFPALALERAAEFKVELTVSDWVILYISMLVTIALHELAHAVVCKHFGARVHRVGLMILYMNPVAFCDITDSWRLPSSKEKALIATAGMFLQAVLLCGAMSLWLLTGGDLLMQYAGANLGLIAVNALPIVKLDGYWIVAHLLDEPNLRTKALGAVDGALRKLLGRKARESGALNPRMLAFGLAQLLAMPVMSVLGIVFFYRVGSYVSVTLGWVVAGILAAALAYRTVSAGVTYVKTWTPRQA